MSLPDDPAEFLNLDAEQRADLLLFGLADCAENECGRNFLLFQLQAWFPEIGHGIGMGVAVTTANQRPNRNQVEDALEDAYARLESQGLIRPNPRAGETFCKLTAEGEAHVRAAQQPDAARIAFAQLFMGFFGTIRNLVSHKDFRYAQSKEAFQALMQLDYLTEKLGVAASRFGKSIP